MGQKFKFVEVTDFKKVEPSNCGGYSIELPAEKKLRTTLCVVFSDGFIAVTYVAIDKQLDFVRLIPEDFRKQGYKLYRKISMPETGQIWQHHMGGDYRIICMANTSSTREDFPPTVVYKGVGDRGRTWSRPLEDFLKKFKMVKLG